MAKNLGGTTSEQPGPWGNAILVSIASRQVATGKKLDSGEDETRSVFDLTVRYAGSDYKEVHRNLSTDAADTIRNARDVLAVQSQLVRIDKARDKLKIPKDSPDTTAAGAAYALAGATDADAGAYRQALALLENEADVDMVLVSVQTVSPPDRTSVRSEKDRPFGWGMRGVEETLRSRVSPIPTGRI